MVGECYCWGRATHRLMPNYVTVFAYCYKLHSVQYTLCEDRTLHPDTQPMQNGFRARVGSFLCRLLWVDVHVLRVSQQANPLLLLPLFCHLKSTNTDWFFKIPPNRTSIAIHVLFFKICQQPLSSIDSFTSHNRSKQMLNKMHTAVLNCSAFWRKQQNTNY